MGACYKCGEPFVEEGAQIVDAVCVKCSSYLHACANCLHFDEYSNNKCREARAPFVFDRLGKNECTFFKVKQIVRLERDRDNKKLSPRAEQKEREGRAREGLERLFKS